LLVYWLNFLTKETLPNKERAVEVLEILKKFDFGSALNAVGIMRQHEVFTESETVHQSLIILDATKGDEQKKYLPWVTIALGNLEEIDDVQKKQLKELRGNLLVHLHNQKKEPKDVEWIYSLLNQQLMEMQMKQSNLSTSLISGKLNVLKNLQ